MSFVPSRWNDVNDWMRMVAEVLNPTANGYPFPQHGSDPSGVNAGYTYYSTALNKVRTWDGSAWNNHW
jgi:hypothetical protein